MLTIDGLDNNDEFSGASRTELSLEIVREFQVVSHGWTTENGGGSGGAINVVTKSGANTTHGDAFVFAPFGALNAPPKLEDTGDVKPALHRYPASMAKRAHTLAVFLVENYDASAENVWHDVASGDELLARVKALPGFGNDKARIFVGLLGKRFGVQPPGWEHAAADWASIADVDSYERIAEIREKKRAMKRQRREAGTPPGAERKNAKAASSGS